VTREPRQPDQAGSPAPAVPPATGAEPAGPVEPVEGGARRPGRPRDSRVDEAILDAAADVLARCGPGGFSVDAVAAEAGVGKATIYRRWPSRAELMLATVHRTALDLADPGTGSVRADLVFVLSALAVKLRLTNVGQLLPALMAEAAVNPEMSRTLGAFMEARRQLPRDILVRAVERGELPADTDVDLALDLLGGAVFFRALVARSPVEPEAVEQMVDAVLIAVGAGGARCRGAWRPSG
jgi:AcrR family transcriptional regulator